MMKLFCYFLLVLCCFYFSEARAQTACRIEGEIRIDQTSAAYIPIQLISAQGSIMTTVLSDRQGRFIFDSLAPSDQSLRIQLRNFQSYQSAMISTKDSCHSNIGMIILKPITNQLKDVQISGQKQYLEYKANKLIINPEALISNTGLTLVEILEKAPSVSLSQQGDIKIGGKSGALIYIDNKPVMLSGDDLMSYLRSISSASIDRVEVIKNPTSHYDAEGNAGIIQIKLKKAKTEGFEAGLSTSYGLGRHMRSANNLNLNYRINQFNFFSNLSWNQNNSYQDLDIWRRYLDLNQQLRTTFRQNTLISPEVLSRSARLGCDYYISNRLVVGISAQGIRTQKEQTLVNNATITDQNQRIQTRIDANNPTNTRLNNLNLNANATIQLDSQGQELQANLDYLIYDAMSTQALKNNAFDVATNQLNSTLLESALPFRFDILIGLLDYKKPLSTTTNLDAGVKLSQVQTDNNAEFYDVIQTQRFSNQEFSNNFNYKENIQAVYGVLNHNINQWSIQLGLRAERTDLSGYQYGNVIQKDSSFSRSYTNLFPNLMLQYTADSLSHHILGWQYSRRIDRPNYKDLNPFTYPLDRYTFYGGNPFLLPSYSDNIEITHTYKNKMTTGLELGLSKDGILETNEQRNGIFYSRPGNFSRQLTLGLYNNVNLSLGKYILIQNYIGGFYTQFQSTVYGQSLEESQYYTVWQPTILGQYKHGWGVEIGGSYQSSVLSGQFVLDPVYALRLGLSKRILKNKGSLRFNVSDIFYTNQITGQIRNIQQSAAGWYSRMDTRVWTLSFSYRFQSGKGLKPRTKNSSETEQQRAKTS